MEDLSYIDPNSPTLRQSLANVLRGMTKKEDYQQMGQAIQNTAQVMPSVLESLARGGIAQVPGTVGDVSQTARDFFPQTMQSTFGNRVAPTTEEILQAVPRINPDYQGSSQHEMVGGLVGPALGKMLKMGAEASKGLKGGLSIENVDRLKVAQHNASLPIKEGGLGLPANNTAMDRAKAMGFDTPVYHGTNEENIVEFITKGKGKTSGAGAFVTTNPVGAETYVGGSGGANILPLLIKKDNFLNVNAKGQNWADIPTNTLNAKAGKKRFNPEDIDLQSNSSTSTDELGTIAKDLGLKGLEIKNVKDLGPNSHIMRAKEFLLEKYGIVPDETWSNVTSKQFDQAKKYQKNFYEKQKSDVYAIQDPSLIRSKFAAFDPKRIKEADILAGGLAIPAGELTRRELLEKQFK
jgi:hypothetical protein